MHLCLKPILPDWLFTEGSSVRDYWDKDRGWHQVEVGENCFAFRFLGHTLVVYHNPSRKATFGAGAASVQSGVFQLRDGQDQSLAGPCFAEEIPELVRRGLIYRIDIHLD
jgi:hypothetical protein